MLKREDIGDGALLFFLPPPPPPFPLSLPSLSRASLEGALDTFESMLTTVRNCYVDVTTATLKEFGCLLRKALRRYQVAVCRCALTLPT